MTRSFFSIFFYVQTQPNGFLHNAYHLGVVLVLHLYETHYGFLFNFIHPYSFPNNASLPVRGFFFARSGDRTKNKNVTNSTDPLIICYFSPNISSIFLHKEENSSSLYKRVSITILPVLSINTLRVMPALRSAYLAKISAPGSRANG